MSKLSINSDLHIDHRTHQTHVKLMTALLAVFTAHQPAQALTVSQLCREARVSRATFYRHHQDIGDIVTVAYLITLRELSDQLSALPTVTYGNLTNAIVHTMVAHPQLPQLAAWLHVEPRVISLESGLVQRVLADLEVNDQQPQFTATYLGNCLHQFNWQLSQMRPQLTLIETARLFNRLIPNVLQSARITP